MGALSITHLLLLAIVVLIIMGSRRLPELGNALGEAIRGFKKGISGNDHESEAKTADSQMAKQMPKDVMYKSEDQYKESQYKGEQYEASQVIQQEAQIAQLKAQIELMRKDQLRIQANLANPSHSQIHQVEFESAKPVEAQIQETKVQKDSTL